MRVRAGDDLGRLVRERRRELGMSQAQLAEAGGVTRQWLVRFEQGRTDVTLSKIMAVLNALSIDLSVESRDRTADTTSRRIPFPPVRVDEIPSDDRLAAARDLVSRLGSQSYESVRAALDSERP